MKARALICDEKQRFSLQEVTIPDPAPNQIAVKTCYSGVSIGTEFALIRNKISWGPYPLCTGYMSTAEVTAVGADVSNFKVGDKVYCRVNGAMKLGNGQAVSPVSGLHASHAVLNPNTTHGAAHMVPGAGMDVAAMFVMPAVGLYGVHLSNPEVGQKVVVHGAGLIGLGVVSACALRGCVVIAVDVNPRQLAIAREMGADYLVDGSKGNVPAEVQKIAPDGADVVFECTGIPACIDPAIELCRTRGSFVWQGNYGDAPVSMKFMPAHGRRLSMFFPCDDGWQPFRRAVIKNMASGALKWEKTITHRISCEEAPAMYERINKGDKDVVGVVIRWE